MGNDTKELSEILKRELLKSAAILYGVQKHYADEIRIQTKEVYGELLSAHLIITGVLSAALLRINGKCIPHTMKGEERNALFASFVIGMEVCERAIEEGRYLQGIALLRQELETLAQLKAVALGARNENKAPNIANVEQSLSRLYGDLSAAAHVSKHHIVRANVSIDMQGVENSGDTQGTRYFPKLDKELARRLFTTHLLITVRLIEEFSVDLEEQHSEDAFTKRDNQALNVALDLMIGEGMLELIDEIDRPKSCAISDAKLGEASSDPP